LNKKKLSVKTFFAAVIILSTLIAVFSVQSVYANGLSAGAYIRWGDLIPNASVDTSGEVGIFYVPASYTSLQISGFINSGETIVSAVYGADLYIYDTDIISTNFDSATIFFKITNSGNTSAVFSLDSSIISLSNSAITDSFSINFYIDSNNDSIFDAGDPMTNSLSLPADTEKGIFALINLLPGILASDTIQFLIKAINPLSDTGGYTGANGRNYCGEGNPQRIIRLRFNDAPQIAITSPVSGSVFSSQVISIYGTAQNCSAGDSIELFVNGISNSLQTISGAGNILWSGTVSISMSNESVTVKLSDSSGRESYYTITISFQPADTPPSINILYPVLSGSVHDTSVLIMTVNGTTNASNGDSVFVTVNNETCYTGIASGNMWNGSAKIPADTVIVKVYVNHNGLWGQDTITVRPGFIITGWMDLGSYDSNAIAKIYNSSETFTGYSDASGSYTLRVVNSDTFAVVFSKNGFKQESILVFINSNTYLGLISLISGDFYQDNSINIRDLAFIKKYWMQPYPEFDIDGDGIIGEAERNAVQSNYGR